MGLLKLTWASLGQWMRWAMERKGKERTAALRSALTFARLLVEQLERATEQR